MPEQNNVQKFVTPAQLASFVKPLKAHVEATFQHGYKEVAIKSAEGTRMYTQHSASARGKEITLSSAYPQYDSYVFHFPKKTTFYINASGLIYCALTVGINGVDGEWTPNETGTGTNYSKTCGGNATRYSTSNNNLPTRESPITVSTSDILVITVPNNQDAHVYVYDDSITILNSNVILSDEQINQCEDASKMLVKTFNNYFYVYMRTETWGRYLKYKVEYFERLDENVEGYNNSAGWVVRTVDLVFRDNGVETTIFHVVTEGEWEMAIKLSGRGDFIGLKNHGSEVQFYNKFYIDGNVFQYSPGKTFYCKTLTFVQNTQMYDPADETTEVGIHYLICAISQNTVEYSQRIVWSVNGTTDDGAFVAMFPLIRGNDNVETVQVTDKAFDDLTLTEYDVSTGGFENYVYQPREPLPPDSPSGTPRNPSYDRDKFYIYGSTSGIFAALEVDIKNKPATAYAFIQNTTNQYNKIYFSYCDGGFNISSGDIWQWKSKYTLTYKQPAE